MVDVAAWLGALGLAKYAQAFADHEIDGDALRHLTDEDLRELGLPVGPRRKILAALVDLATHPAPDGAAPEAKTVAVAAQAERRQLTVMFVDLVGSTELSLKLDPEELRDLSRGYGDAVSREVGRYGGHVAKYMGDGVLVYFGYPQAHEDDAVRAIYAGLAVTRAVKRLGKRMLDALGGRLRARVGVATGLVVGDLVGTEGSETGAVTGETPNLAFRLQEAAGSGRVVVSERTRQLAGDAFTYEEPEERKLKGFPDPARLWRVLGPSGAESRFEALHGRWLTPLVGREHELALLLERWRQVKEGEGQVVLLSGEAGIGKSRITEALRERVLTDEHVRIRLQCSPYHVNSVLFPVIEHLERAARFERDDPHGTKLDKLEALIGLDGTIIAEVAALFAALLSIPTGDRYPPLAMSPERQKERTLAALADQVGGLAAATPVLIIVEDIHWVDPTTLELLDLLVTRIEDLRSYMVMTTRPEFVSPWPGRPHVTTLSLNRLSKRQGALMVEGVTGGKTLPPEVMEQVVARTDGVPLFVEELTRMVMESGLLREEAGGYVLDGPLPPLAIPATLHDSLMARLDRLAPAKEVAQTAAAIGRTFSHDLLATVAAMDEDKLIQALGQLVDAGLLFRQGTPPAATYTFKHALVQSAAYESLLKSQRQRFHAAIAEAMATRFADMAVTAPELVAHHYAEAGLTDRAVPLWIAATALAADRSANAEAVAHARRGLDCVGGLPAGPGRDRAELELLTLLGPALRIIDGYASPASIAAYDRATALTDRVNDPTLRFHTLFGRILIHIIRADHRMGLDLALQSADAARAADDVELRLQAHRLVGAAHYFRGFQPVVLREAEAAGALYDPARHRLLASRYSFDPLAVLRAYASLALWLLGYPRRAAAEAQRAMEVALATEHTHTIGMTQAFPIWRGVMARDWEGVMADAPAAIDFCARDRLPVWMSFSRVHFGMAKSALGFAEGAKEAETGVAEWQAMGHMICATHMNGLVAATRTAVGDWDESFRRLNLAFATADAGHEHYWLAELQRQRGALILDSGRGSVAEAEASFAMALETARAQQTRSLELRAAMSLARLWADRGERRRAHGLLAPVYGWFTEGLETRDLIEAKALLEGLS
ncbi:MAG: AAA family ATPase [Alphaproteobacteria bacterium]